jgi:hypothetical protein
MQINARDLEAAVNRCLDECTQFPRIAEILARVPQVSQAEHESFWCQQLHDLQRGDSIGDFTRRLFKTDEGKALLSQAPQWFRKAFKDKE